MKMDYGYRYTIQFYNKGWHIKFKVGMQKSQGCSHTKDDSQKSH